MRKAILPALVLALALFLTIRSINANKDLVPFLGKWSGGFEVSQIQNANRDTPEDRRRLGLMGYLMVYGSRHSFKIHLEGEQEVFDIGGKWAIKGQRLILTADPQTFALDDEGGAESRNPNRKFIPADDLRAAFGKPIPLDLSKDKKAFASPLTSIGNLIGAFRFKKESF